MALEDNLIAYWKMDESSGNAADATGNGRTLTNNNSITYSTGKINNCAVLSRGSTQRFSGTDSGLFPTGNQTYQFWLNPNAPAGSRFLLWNTYSGSTGLITSLENSSGLKLRVAIYNSSGSPTNKDYQSTIAISSSTWTHLVIVYTAASGQWEFYVNGSLVHTETGFPTSVTAKSTAYFGIDGGADTANYYDGKVDEMALWSRALTSSEVTQLYNSGNGLAYPFAVNVTVSSTVVTATFSAPASTVSGGASVAPAVQAATFSVPASAVSGGATIASSVLSAVFSIPTVNIITPDAQILATVLTATFSLPTATPSGGASVDATVQSATFSIPTVSFIGSVTISPDAQVATFSTPAPTISAIGNVTVSASTVAATFSLQSPTVTAEQNAMFNAGVLSATFSVQEPTITAERNVIISASVISATFSIPTPLRKVGGLWTAQPRAQGVWTPQPRAI